MSVKPVPEGMHTMTAHLVCADAPAAIEFYKRAFDAVEESRMIGGPGNTIMHASLKVGDSHIFLMEEAPAWNSFGPKALKGSPVTLHMYVKDADSVFAQAIAAGGKALMPPADMFWGDRYGVLEDPCGHRWAIATHTRDLTPAEIEKGMKAQMGCG